MDRLELCRVSIRSSFRLGFTGLVVESLPENICQFAVIQKVPTKEVPSKFGLLHRVSTNMKVSRELIEVSYLGSLWRPWVRLKTSRALQCYCELCLEAPLVDMVIAIEKFRIVSRFVSKLCPLSRSSGWAFELAAPPGREMTPSFSSSCSNGGDSCERSNILMKGINRS